MIALPSRSEVQSAPLAEINATPQALPAVRSYSEPVPNTRARVTTRAPIASGASQASVQTTYTQYVCSQSIGSQLNYISDPRLWLVSAESVSTQSFEEGKQACLNSGTRTSLYGIILCN